MYIISQILVTLGMIVDLTGKIFKNKKSILFFIAIASILYTLSYVFLFSPLPAIANGIASVRTFLYLYFDKKNKSKKWYLTAMIILNTIFITFAIIFWKNPLDLVLITSIFILSVGLAFKNTNIVRITLMANSMLWMCYNLSLSAYMNFACDIISFMLTLGALIYYNKITKKENKQLEEKTSEEKATNENLIDTIS